MVQLGLADILQVLYGSLLLPREVAEELSQENTPAAVRSWINNAPTWVQILDPTPVTNPILLRLDAGEREALQLALDKAAVLVLVDERKGVRIARSLGLAVTGTLGILRDAHNNDLIDARVQYLRLTVETNFRHTDNLFSYFLKLLKT
jgi:predicted nucleic acid-binding protein